MDDKAHDEIVKFHYKTIKDLRSENQKLKFEIACLKKQLNEKSN